MTLKSFERAALSTVLVSLIPATWHDSSALSMNREIRSKRDGVIGRGAGLRELWLSDVVGWTWELATTDGPVSSREDGAGANPKAIIKEQEAAKEIKIGIGRWKAGRLYFSLTLKTSNGLMLGTSCRIGSLGVFSSLLDIEKVLTKYFRAFCQIQEILESLPRVARSNPRLCVIRAWPYDQSGGNGPKRGPLDLHG